MNRRGLLYVALAWIIIAVTTVAALFVARYEWAQDALAFGIIGVIVAVVLYLLSVVAYQVGSKKV